MCRKRCRSELIDSAWVVIVPREKYIKKEEKEVTTKAPTGSDKAEIIIAKDIIHFLSDNDRLTGENKLYLIEHRKKRLNSPRNYTKTKGKKWPLQS